ncbi:MAG: methyltransferase, partial [Candidatus Micrarchaeota archaeon]|nr:methyltransferase [Candidatus Micrarchaeota archaeon]
MINFKGMSLTTSVNVYVPSDDSFIAADVVENLVAEFKGNKLDVLDMGSGTGILGLVAAKSPKVSSVIFADINEDAVKMCKENVNLNANLLHAKCVVKMSDLFSNVDGKFDILIFNAPYLRSDKEDEKRGTISKSWAGGPEG